MFGIPFSGSTVHMNSERNLVRILKWHSRLCVNNGNGVCAGRVLLLRQLRGSSVSSFDYRRAPPSHLFQLEKETRIEADLCEY
jgi:hypothetical protein